MQCIETLDDLTALYDADPPAAAMRKVSPCLTPLYAKWIQASRFCILSTVGPQGTDGSPRGDEGPVVTELDASTLAMPDWRGNNRLDSLRNIVSDGRVSLLFMVPRSDTVVRVNGTAILTTDTALLTRFARKQILPRCVIVVSISEVYTQCARALMRSRLWATEAADPDLPRPGEILSEMTQGEIGGATYERDWPARARASMW